MTTPATQALLLAIQALEDEDHRDIAIQAAQLHLTLQRRLRAKDTETRS